MKTILIIDDNEMFRFILAEWLKTEGFYPITAENGFEGLRLIRSHHPDLIFCDINMPILDGNEVLKKVKNDVNVAHIPFFFLTSEVRLIPTLMQQLGVTGVISKESEIEELRKALSLIGV